MKLSAVLSAGALLAALPIGIAQAATAVPGDTNPNLAGRTGGYACCGGDSVPNQSPVEYVETPVATCDLFFVTSTGRVSYEGSAVSGNDPDGDQGFSMTGFGDGISAPLNVRANALVGVFLSDASPSGRTTPPSLDFSASALGLDFLELSPKLGQIFFIGDGRTSDSELGSDGPMQVFQAPVGATRLFFGTADGTGWFNNSGSFEVTVDRAIYINETPCGDPATPSGITAGDALRILKVAVGGEDCELCVCDADGSGSTVASDALLVLRRAVGQDVDLACRCCFLEGGA